MKIILLVQTLVTVALGLPLYLTLGEKEAFSFLIGAVLILVNAFLLWFAWKLIFTQKFVALSIGVIVFKYAILGIFIFKIIKEPWLDLLWFSMGIATFIAPAVAYAVVEARKKQEGM